METNAWHASVRGTLQFQICKKLKQIKYGLKEANSGVIGDIPLRIQLVREKLHTTQQQIMVCPTSALRSLEQSTSAELIMLLKLEDLCSIRNTGSAG